MPRIYPAAVNALTDSLSWREVAAIAGGARLSLAESAWARIAHARALLEVIVERGTRCYGVNTGVGASCDLVVPRESQLALSRNIVMSHACGVGEPLGRRETRAIMAAAINNFAHGRSGVRAIIVEHLAALLAADLIPVVPRQGSIGYLTHMAHIALVLLGFGQATGEGAPISGAEALRRAGLAPLILEAKEGLSLVNGTPCVTGLACVALERLQRLLDWSDVIAAMSFENVGSQLGAFAPAVIALRGSAGMAHSAACLTALTQGSQILAQARQRTQDALSLRAVPQVHGAVRDRLREIAELVDRELGAATDNPILAGTLEAPLVYSEAHPIATAMAMAMDSLSIAAAKLAAMSERRIDRLLNPLVSGLPGFLAAAGGVASGLMIAQYTALSLVSENRRLAAPASLDGGVSSGLQEDEIPHSTPAALKALQVLDNLQTVLGIELMAASQAYELQPPALARAAGTDRVYRQFRQRVKAYADERPLGEDIARAAQHLDQAPGISS